MEVFSFPVSPSTNTNVSKLQQIFARKPAYFIKDRCRPARKSLGKLEREILKEPQSYKLQSSQLIINQINSP